MGSVEYGGGSLNLNLNLDIIDRNDKPDNDVDYKACHNVDILFNVQHSHYNQFHNQHHRSRVQLSDLRRRHCLYRRPGGDQCR